MDEATRKHVEKLVAMPLRTFLDVCVAWKEETGEDFSCVAQTLCPVHQYAMQKGRCLAVTGHTELCPVCEKPMCPTCGSHCVDQISRVTGTCRRYPVGIPRKNRSTKTGIGTAFPARKCSETIFSQKIE